MQRAQREVMRGPRSDPRQGGRIGDEPIEIAAVEPERARGDRGRDPVDRIGARGRQPDRADPRRASSDDLRGRREPRRQAIARRCERATERGGEPAGERRRSCDRHLLPEQRADRRLEAVDRSRDAQAGTLRDEAREQRIAAEHASNHIRSRVEIEHSTHPCDERHEDAHERRLDREHERIAIARRPKLDDPDRAIEVNDPAIAPVMHLLDARNRARGEEAEDRGEVIRRAIVEAQLEQRTARDRIDVLAAQLAGCASHHLREHRVEPAHAAVAGRERDVGQRQRGVL